MRVISYFFNRVCGLSDYFSNNYPLRFMCRNCTQFNKKVKQIVRYLKIRRNHYLRRAKINKKADAGCLLEFFLFCREGMKEFFFSL